MGNRGKVAKTPEADEQEIIALAQEEARRRIANRTASSQLLSIYVKEGTVEARLNRQKKEEEIKLLQAKTKSIEDAADGKTLLADALHMFKKYSGNFHEDVEDI